MFLILLKFTERRALAGQFMAAHNDWLRRGFDDRVFVLAGGLPPQQGGALLAIGTTREALMARVQDDPFVAEGIVTPELLEIAPVRVDERLALLAERAA
jgi:uncharacterized protein YciI